MPALGGPKPKLDPRFKGKVRPAERKKTEGDPDAERQELSDRQAQNLDRLEAADQSLGSGQQTLEGMLQQLRQALEQGRTPNGKPQGGNAQQGQDLGQMLQSDALQQALAMAARMRQLAQGKSNQGEQQGLPAQSQSSTGNLQGAPRVGGGGEADLSSLDPATRSVIMKMQPKLREELLQGMREEGPEGYRKFIQDYFRRLSKEKSSK